MFLLLPLLCIYLSTLTTELAASLSLDFKVTRISRQHNTANCNVGNTTYAHGETFKLDCKTQCVCENGRHACSSLCPKEQLPAPEDTISCRSPRLVEVPGHCCRMWLCENPTADVYATCHNSSSSPWTPCSQYCGLGIATRQTSTTAGCHQLSSLRLCENRRCDYNSNKHNIANEGTSKQAQLNVGHNVHDRSHSHNYDNGNRISWPEQQHDFDALIQPQLHNNEQRHRQQHKIRKGHECRNIQRLGSARIRLGKCISKKLYRPKVCGRCYHAKKCCTPLVSTTIQVELLCPLNSIDPLTFARQQTKAHQPLPLWDTVSLEPIDQEFLQAHQIQIENKFIAVEWILKCQCNQNEQCEAQTDHSNYTDNINNGNSRNGASDTTTALYDTVREEQHNKPTVSPISQLSSEIQPDIIPYPLLHPRTKLGPVHKNGANKNNKHHSNNNINTAYNSNVNSNGNDQSKSYSFINPYDSEGSHSYSYGGNIKNKAQHGNNYTMNNYHHTHNNNNNINNNKNDNKKYENKFATKFLHNQKHQHKTPQYFQQT